MFRVAAAVYLLANLLVAASPVVMLASGVAMRRVASNASRRVVGQWGGAGGAIYEEHLALAGRVRALRGGLTRLENPKFSTHNNSQTSPSPAPLDRRRLRLVAVGRPQRALSAAGVIARHANSSTQSHTKPSDARGSARRACPGRARRPRHHRSRTPGRKPAAFVATHFARAASTTLTTARGENPSICPARSSTSRSCGGAGESPPDCVKQVATNRDRSKGEGIGTFNNWSKAAKPSVARDRNARRRRDGVVGSTEQVTITITRRRHPSSGPMHHHNHSAPGPSLTTRRAPTTSLGRRSAWLHFCFSKIRNATPHHGPPPNRRGPTPWPDTQLKDLSHTLAGRTGSINLSSQRGPPFNSLAICCSSVFT